MIKSDGTKNQNSYFLEFIVQYNERIMLSADFYSQDNEEVEEPFLRISHKKLKSSLLRYFQIL